VQYQHSIIVAVMIQFESCSPRRGRAARDLQFLQVFAIPKPQTNSSKIPLLVPSRFGGRGQKRATAAAAGAPGEN
jgi:hypothetical protein